MATKLVDCGFNPRRKNREKPVQEIDCGFNPPSRKTAGPERGTTEGPGPTPTQSATAKHQRRG